MKCVMVRVIFIHRKLVQGVKRNFSSVNFLNPAQLSGDMGWGRIYGLCEELEGVVRTFMWRTFGGLSIGLRPGRGVAHVSD